MRSVAFDSPITLASEFFATFHRSGRIFGSAFVELDVDGRRVLFSGDLGRQSHPLLFGPARRPRADVVVIGSTYGGRAHAGDETRTSRTVVGETVAHRGSVLIPAFAVDRTEIVLHLLKRLRDAAEIPPVPVFMDNSMALKALDTYQHAIATRSGDDVRPDLGADPLGLEHVQLAGSVGVHGPEPSCTAVHHRLPSPSGMASGGRVVHHLAHLLSDRRNTVVSVGYQAIRTARLRPGARRVCHQAARSLRARASALIESLDGMSVHADEGELFTWLRDGEGVPDVTYVISTGPGRRRRFQFLADRIVSDLGWLAVLPATGRSSASD